MTKRIKYDPDNIFAKILRGDMPCVKICEDDDILAFMDIFPQSKGHSLVIPKRAKATMIFDIDPDELSGLTLGVQKVAKAIDKALEPDGVRIVQFNGSESGQTIFHIHFHIIPVYAGAPVRPHAGGAPADTAVLTEIAAKIAAAL
ncbi:MAG: HIT domain-containing protein [Alphaproteobacteria bacterium]|nr:HIT domain-containing protein [Alphaproteobacteria bacterium]